MFEVWRYVPVPGSAVVPGGDGLVVMDKGVIVEQGAPEDFFGNPKNERLRNFLGQIA